MPTVAIPEIKDILKTGLQFGHSSSRWNPKMSEYIFGEKNGIHVIDVIKTQSQLQKAAEALFEIAKTKEVLFVGSKRQAAEIVKSEAIRAGAHFVINRWPGGLLTNFKMVKQSLAKLQGLEKSFEQGVQGRTKYEVMQMKGKWERLNRLYAGIKQMQSFPGAVVVIDPRYERVAVKEAKLMNIPIIALADTNCDPDLIDFVIPGNDDALAAVETVMKVLTDAVAAGNEGKGIQHNLQDYSRAEVAIHKAVTVEEAEAEAAEPAMESAAEGEVTTSAQPRLKVSTSQLAKATTEEKPVKKAAAKPKATTATKTASKKSTKK